MGGTQNEELEHDGVMEIRRFLGGETVAHLRRAADDSTRRRHIAHAATRAVAR
jgi:hypothetical protein